ncbi:MAG: DUF3822 family protein [Bacteroidaceae bacterium]|nr:DUF3822 family protein [Bacteroidaceae bacterium]
MLRLVTTTLVTGSNHPSVVDYVHAEQYTLSIRVSADGFCFAAHHPERTDEFAYMPYEVDPLLPVVVNLKKAKETLPMLQHRYGVVQMLLADAPCQVVPEEYAEVQGIGERIVRLSEYALALRFQADTMLMKWAEEAFPGLHIFPGLFPVLRFALQRNDITLCHLHGRRMDMICVRGGRLLFVNTFDSDTAANALYYLLGTWQTLGLSQQDDVLTIVGRSSCRREFAAKASRFIRHVVEPNPAELFHTTELARLSAVPFDVQTLVNG